MKYQIIILLCAFSLCAMCEDVNSENDLPNNAKGELNKLGLKVIDCKKETIVALEKILKEEMKKENINAAVAIRDQIDMLKASILFENSSVIDRSIIGFPVGKWKIFGVTESYNGEIAVNNDRTWTSPWPDLGGDWKIENGKMIFISKLGNNQKIETNIGKTMIMNINSGRMVIRIKYIDEKGITSR